MKIRINLTIESDLDAELYGYLMNIAPRRRATLLRTLATQGLNGDHYLKAGFVKKETGNKQEINENIYEIDTKNDSSTINELTITDSKTLSEEAKSKSFSNALGDMM